MGEVVWLGRYPVKSMLGEELTEVAVDGSGVAGDRRYALIDAATGLVASAKNPRKWRALLTMAARCVPPDDLRVAVTLPGGAVLRGDDPATDAALSRAVGRPVRLAGRRPAGAAIERETPFVEESPGVLTRGVLPAGESFVDFGQVHLVTTATLSALARHHPQGTVDARRFRPNVVLRMYDDVPFAENGWPGRTLSVLPGGGSATPPTGGAGAVEEGVALRVVVPTPRCVVPTLAQGDGLAEDRDVLRAAARLNRTPVLDLGRLTCVGAYASVARGGRLRVGDTVVVR